RTQVQHATIAEGDRGGARVEAVPPLREDMMQRTSKTPTSRSRSRGKDLFSPSQIWRHPGTPNLSCRHDTKPGQHLASVLQEGRENANIAAGLGFIWRISDTYISRACSHTNEERGHAH